MSGIINKNLNKVKNNESYKQFQDLIKPLPLYNYHLADSSHLSSHSNPCVPSSIAKDPSNKSTESFQSCGEKKKPLEGYLKEVAESNEGISNENKNSGSVGFDSLLSMETKPLQCLNKKEGEEVHIQNTQQTNTANDLVQPKGSESEESQLVKSIEIDSKLSISQSIPNSSQNVTTKALGPHSAESKAEDSLKLSEENAMPTYPVTIVSKKETMLVKHM